MKSNNRIKQLVAAALVFAVSAAGCSSEKKSEKSEESVSQLSSEIHSSDTVSREEITPIELDNSITTDTSALFSDRDLNPDYDSFTAEIQLSGDSATVSGTGASCEGSVITVTDEGVYRVSGTLSNGKIIINSQAKIQLVLDNADITCEDSAPIYVVNADKTFITLAEGSVNTLTDGSSYIYENETDNEPDAVIFSHDSLTVNGTGTLNINANYNEGITSKDDIVITGGKISITSVGNAVKGKNYVAVTNADITVNSQADGIKSTNTEAGTGFVCIKDGTFDITAAEDGFQAESEFICENGTFTIVSGGGNAQGETHTDNDFSGRRDFFGQNNSSDSTADAAEDTTISKKGIKGGTAVHISGGSFNIDSADDALHSNGFVYISGGELSLLSGDDGINADSHICIDGGSVAVEKSYEGIESAVIGIKGGTVDVTASDDGFNASDGSTSQGGMGVYSEGVQLFISGGSVHVNSDGDGLDSNGDILICGGNIYVDGPTNGGNSALDGNGEIICTGGALAAAGSSQMAEYPGSSSTQYSVSAGFEQTYQAGTEISLCDSSGEAIISFTSEKTFNHIVLSSPDIKAGETYTITADGAEAGSFTAEDITSFIGSGGNMMGGGFGGGFGGGGFGGGNFGGGNFGGDFQMPTNENGEFEMPEGDFGRGPGNRGDMQMPTNENGEIETPEMPEGGFGGGFGGGGGFGDMEPPTNENGEYEMPQGGFNPFSAENTANTY